MKPILVKRHKSMSVDTLEDIAECIGLVFKNDEVLGDYVKKLNKEINRTNHAVRRHSKNTAIGFFAMVIFGELCQYQLVQLCKHVEQIIEKEGFFKRNIKALSHDTEQLKNDVTRLDKELTDLRCNKEKIERLEDRVARLDKFLVSPYSIKIK